MDTTAELSFNDYIIMIPTNGQIYVPKQLETKQSESKQDTKIIKDTETIKKGFDLGNYKEG